MLGMCEDKRARGGDGSAKAARFGVGEKGIGGLCQFFSVGGQWMIRWGRR